MCTVLLRLAPGADSPVLLGAMRDEFVERTWDPPGRHWGGEWEGLVGGRDHTGGGTWLAVDPEAPAVAALLNAGRRADDQGLPRPTRGMLALRILREGTLPADVHRYDCFHLLRATPAGGELWSWDGKIVTHTQLAPGDHVIVNAGLDTSRDPLVPHFAPLLAALGASPAEWMHLLAGDDLDPGDERALVVRKEIEGRAYGSTSATFVALSGDGLRYHFTATPTDPSSWSPVG